MLRVFHRGRAGRPFRIIWTLEEIGAPYELVVMDQEEGSGEEHRRRHPLGRVPVLQDDQGFLFESAALCLHVADLHPDAELVPPLGTHDRALAYQWAVFAPAELEPPLFEAWIQSKKDPERASAAGERFAAAAAAVAGAMDGQEYLVGGRFSVADVLVSTALMFAPRAGLADKLPPSMAAYGERLAQRPAYQRAMQRAYG